MDADRLDRAVDEAFHVTGSATPGWPNPHPDMQSPLEEEYERCLDPGKYLILRARIQAWTQAVTGLGLATVEQCEPSSVRWKTRKPRQLQRTVWLRPLRDGALPVLVGFDDFDGIAEAVLALGAGAPAVFMGIVPACGCDACDDGSEKLLEELDEQVRAVISGTYVWVKTSKGIVTATESEWGGPAGLSPDKIDALLAKARAGRSRHPAVHGNPWF